MPIIKSIREFKWDLSKKGFKNTVCSFVSLFTDEKKLEKWVYMYSFIIVPLLNFLILRRNEVYLISIGGSFPRLIYSPINMVLMSILIAFTIFIFTISLLNFTRIRPLLFSSMFTQILILFFEINIIKKHTLYYPDSSELFYLFLILFSLSILFAILHLSKMIYLRIRARVLLKRELKISEV